MSKSISSVVGAPAVGRRGKASLLLVGLLRAIAVASAPLNKKPLAKAEKPGKPAWEEGAGGPQVGRTGESRTSAKGAIMSKNPLSQEDKAILDAAFARPRVPRDNARRLFRQGKLKAAEAECRRAMALAPLINGQPAYIGELTLLGDILLTQGRNREALKCYLGVRTSSIPDNPQKPRPNLNAALAYCRMGNFAMAKKYYPPQTLSSWFSAGIPPVSQATTNIRAMEASILLLRGFDLKSCADDEGALPYLQAANKLSPHNWRIIYAIADSLHHLKRREEAIPYYRMLIRLRGAKTDYDVRMRVEMYDLAKKRKQLVGQAQRAATNPYSPR